jgi:hypothetical protein
MRRGRHLLIVAALVLPAAALAAGPSRAAEVTTRCSFGGPAGASSVFRLSLPSGSSFLNLTVTGGRVSRPTGTRESWHLARGVFVVDEASGRVVSHRISSEGSAPRRSVVEADGIPRTEAETPGPDAPFAHTSLVQVPRLDPGSYLVVAFASDGDAALPNDGWGGFVEVSGTPRCEPLGPGRILDVDHTDFSGGTQVSTYGASVIDGASLARDVDGDLVVGLMDASTQVQGEAVLDYVTPGGTGTVEDAIVPFASPGGPFQWTARAHGVSPLIAIAALAVDLS